jgi:hypothetical protein
MRDIVQRLRDRAFAFKAPDPLLEEAADEIERLRLTDAERQAVEFFSRIDGPGNVPVANQKAATLRDLLERLG